jgi:outer membrane cobalamin receptor
LGPESLYNYELGLTFGISGIQARIQAFDFELLDPIVSRTLLFPLGSVPAAVAGIPVTPLAQSPAQLQQGVVSVATSLSPRSVKSTVNDGHSKYYGFESVLRASINSKWSVEGNYSFMVGRDLYPNRNARRLPPQQGALSIRFAPAPRFWLEVRNRFAGAQDRLNGGDIDDDRIGAARSRTDMANFFRGGFASSYIQQGADGVPGTADDVFAPTGETLRQIQDRLLPIGATINGVRVAGDSTKVPLYLGTAGWYTLDVLGALSLGEGTILHFGIGNLGDRNYRIHGSGVDCAGRNAYAGLRYRF